MEKSISIVIPTYNEERNIRPLYNILKKVLNNLNKDYEIIFIDDGSTDTTISELVNIHKEDNKVNIIQFQRNFGKAAALMAGFKEAQGDLVFTMDADLQDDPNEIPNFINKINQGYSLVSGWKHKRHDPITKTIPSKLFNWTTAKVTGVKIHDANCGFKCYKKEVIKSLDIYGELHRYIPALVHWKGYKVGEIKVTHHPRKFGKSKYGFSRLFKGFLDLITIKYLTTYTRRPLHLFGFIGFVSVFLGVLSGIYLTYLKFLGKSIGDRPLLVLTILLVFLGMQFISLGLIGEMINRQSKKEEYIIKRTIK